jgi:hypothetical protein
VTSPELYRQGHSEELVEVPVRQVRSVVYPGQYEVSGIEAYRPYSKRIQTLITEFHHEEPKTGLRITFSENNLMFALVPQLSETVMLRREDTIAKSEHEVEFQALLEAKKGIGGIGVTARNLASIRKNFGETLDQILEKPGVQNVTFLGNGLSQAPLELSREFAAKGRELHVSLVDLFSYQDFLQSLHNLEERWHAAFAEEQLALHPQLALFKDLARQIVDGEVSVAPKYRFQVEQSAFTELPEEIQNTQVVINVMGPPFLTIADQLRVFSDDGPAYLLTVVDVEEVVMPPGWERLDLGTFDVQASGPKAVVFSRA